MMPSIACHECDLVHTIPPLTGEAQVCCVRCGALLARAKTNSIDRTIAWTVAGLILYAVSITFPFLAIRTGDILQQTGLLSGVRQLYEQGEIPLATLVLLTCVLIPLFQMLGLLYVFVPLRFALRAKFSIAVFRMFRHLRPWSMMEIYLLGILVALVKLGKVGTIIPGLAVISFGLLTFALNFAISAVDARLVWSRLGGEP